MQRASRSKAKGWHIALLRGINVSGKNMLPMPELTKIFATAGCGDVKTYIQSGNVVFCARDGVVDKLAGLITQQIEERFGCKVPLVLRTAAELGEVVRSNPFLKAGAAEESLHVYFLAGMPTAGDVAGLDAGRSAPDAFAVIGREIYLQLPNGMGRTKLTNAYFDSKLKTVSTARNWRTVSKLLEMVGEPG